MLGPVLSLLVTYYLSLIFTFTLIAVARALNQLDLPERNVMTPDGDSARFHTFSVKSLGQLSK